jgi:hypothetical protein
VENHREHNRKVILSYLKESGALYKKENILFAEKAFTISSVLNWCLEKVESGHYTENEVAFYIQSMNEYINGNIRVYWSEDGSLVIGA